MRTSGSVSSTSSFVMHCPSTPFSSNERRSAGTSIQPQRRGRPVTEPNSLPRRPSVTPVSSVSSVGNGPVPTRVVIHAASDAALRPTMAVASSLLRNLPVEAAFLDIQSPSLPEEGRATQLRHLLDARSEAAAVHGLDVRTELRFGDSATELSRELAAEDIALLIVGLPLAPTDAWQKLRPIAKLLDARGGDPVLIVRAAT